MKINMSAAVLLALMPGLCFTTEMSTTTVTAAAVAASTRTYIDKLSDPDSNVRKEAVTFLGMEKNTKNLPHLLKMLKDQNNEVRRVAIEACMRTGLPKAIAPLILEMFRSETEVGVINAAIDSLSRMQYKPAIPEVRKKLDHQFPTIRTYAVKALGVYGGPENFPLVEQKLLDPAEGVRLEAMKVVTKLKITTAEPNLIQNLKYPMGVIRREAARALGEVGSPAALEELSKLKNDSDKSVTAAVAAAIENINKRSAGK